MATTTYRTPSLIARASRPSSAPPRVYNRDQFEYSNVFGKETAHIIPVKRHTKVRVGMWMAFKMMFKGYIHPEEQLKVKHMLQEYDDPRDGDPENALVISEMDGEGVKARKPRHSNEHWWAGYSLLAHAQFHSPKFTRANEMVVSAWIRKTMEQDKVRRVDIARVLPLATRFAFVPTEADVMATKVDNAPATRRRYKKAETAYWTNWFGARRGHYESSD